MSTREQPRAAAPPPAAESFTESPAPRNIPGRARSSWMRRGVLAGITLAALGVAAWSPDRSGIREQARARQSSGCTILLREGNQYGKSLRQVAGFDQPRMNDAELRLAVQQTLQAKRGSGILVLVDPGVRQHDIQQLRSLLADIVPDDTPWSLALRAPEQPPD